MSVRFAVAPGLRSARETRFWPIEVSPKALDEAYLPQEELIMAFGDVIEVDEQTLLLTGQALLVDKGQPDVANALLHRANRTLFLIDTGTTEAFRDALIDATTQIGTWDSLVLLTTHGHADHVGNNDLGGQVVADRDGKVRCLGPLRGLAQVGGSGRYLTSFLQGVAGMLPDSDNAAEGAARLLSIFRPLNAL